MALAKTDRGSFASSDDHGTGAFTTSSFTPSNNSLLVVCAWLEGRDESSDISGSLTISDSVGLSLTARGASSKSEFWACALRVWTAPVTTGTSMTVSIDCGAVNAYKYFAQIFDFTGYDAGSPIGATVTGVNGSSTGAYSISLSGAPAASSIVMAFLGAGNLTSAAATPGSGYTEIYDQELSGELGAESQFRTGSTSTTVAWVAVYDTIDTTGAFAFALEIKEDAGGGGGGDAVPQVWAQYRRRR